MDCRILRKSNTGHPTASVFHRSGRNAPWRRVRGSRVRRRARNASQTRSAHEIERKIQRNSLIWWVGQNHTEFPPYMLWLGRPAAAPRSTRCCVTPGWKFQRARSQPGAGKNRPSPSEVGTDSTMAGGLAGRMSQVRCGGPFLRGWSPSLVVVSGFSTGRPPYFLFLTVLAMKSFLYVCEGV